MKPKIHFIKHSNWLFKLSMQTIEIYFVLFAWMIAQELN